MQEQEQEKAETVACFASSLEEEADPLLGARRSSACLWSSLSGEQFWADGQDHQSRACLLLSAPHEACLLFFLAVLRRAHCSHRKNRRNLRAFVSGLSRACAIASCLH